MVIAIILVILSIAFLVFTFVYVNRKKKKYNKELKSNGLSNNKEDKKSHKNIADILNIQIKDNILKIGNRYSSIVRLGNIDYHMLSESEQETIENILVQTALSIDYPIQFYNTTENIDTSKIIEEIKQTGLDSIEINEYKQYMIKYLENLMESRNISVVRNYAVISYDGDYEDARYELMRLVNSFKNNLLRAKIQVDILEEIDLYNLLYRELNRNSRVKLNLSKEGGKNLYVGKRKKAKKAEK